LKAEGDQVARLLQLATEWKSQNEAQVKGAEHAAVEFRQERADKTMWLQAKRAEAERIKRLPAQAVLAMSDDEIGHAFNEFAVHVTSSYFEDRWGIPVTDGIHPAITFMQQLDVPTLLPSLTLELKHQLQQFLGAVKLDVSRMTHDLMLNDHCTAQDDRHGLLTMLLCHAIVVCA
jgi:hypothetical protein